MSVLKRNILANFMGQGWVILVNAFAVPFYIKLMGIEAYGLVGFYITVQAVFNYFLDFGLSTTINREVARYSAFPQKNNETRSLVRTLGTVYWVIGVFLGLLVILTSGWIAGNWINVEDLPISIVKQTLMVMGVVVIFQWPLSFYQGALMGLQELVLLNRLNALAVTFRTLSTLIVLWLVSPTILAFFCWQVAISLIQVFVTAFLLWRKLPASKDPVRFDLNLLKSIWRFAVGMSLTSFLSFFLSQADRIVLSKLVTLEMFGYYTVAVTANSAFRVIYSQIASAIFPRFSALVANDNQGELRDLYHKGSQFTSVVVLPVAFIASFFSLSLFLVWTQDMQVAAAAAPIASLLFIGTAINGLLAMPYNLTLAYGWSSYGVYQNLAAVALFTPLMIFLVARYGGMGAAVAWMLLNIGYILFMPPIVHRYYLQKELWQWYLKDIGTPLVIAVGSSVLFRCFTPAHMSQIFSIIYVVFAGLVTLLFVILSLKEVRVILKNIISDRWYGNTYA